MRPEYDRLEYYVIYHNWCTHLIDVSHISRRHFQYAHHMVSWTGCCLRESPLNLRPCLTDNTPNPWLFCGAHCVENSVSTPTYLLISDLPMCQTSPDGYIQHGPFRICMLPTCLHRYCISRWMIAAVVVPILRTHKWCMMIFVCIRWI